MLMRSVLAGLLVTFAASHAAATDNFTIKDVDVVADVPLADIKPGTIVFSDHRKAKFADADTGLIEFANWARAKPDQRRFLALYPSYMDSIVPVTAPPETGGSDDAKVGPATGDKTDAAEKSESSPQTESPADAKSDASAESGTDADKDNKADSKPAPKATAKTGSKSKNSRNKAPERLFMYIAEARFVLPRAPASVDVKRYLNIAFLEKIDPSIKHAVITPGDVQPMRAARELINRNPDRAWCQASGESLCIQSRYQFEGKLPTGIKLANKLFESNRRIADHMTFQSEMRLLSPADIDQTAFARLTGVEMPVAGVVEQSIFYVNQVMQFGKFLVVLQEFPDDPQKTVVTAYMVLAMRSNLIESKKQYANVPVLRNLVPVQVLLGNSSFNTGESISAGLPKYTRNRIKAIAGFLAND